MLNNKGTKRFRDGGRLFDEEERLDNVLMEVVATIVARSQEHRYSHVQGVDDPFRTTRLHFTKKLPAISQGCKTGKQGLLLRVTNSGIDPCNRKSWNQKEKFEKYAR